MSLPEDLSAIHLAGWDFQDLVELRKRLIREFHHRANAGFPCHFCPAVTPAGAEHECIGAAACPLDNVHTAHLLAVIPTRPR